MAKEDKRPEFYKNRVNAGLHVINTKILEKNISSKKIDLDRQLLKAISWFRKKCIVMIAQNMLKDMGTPDRYYSVCCDFKRRQSI